MSIQGTPAWVFKFEAQQLKCGNNAEEMIDWLLTHGIAYGMEPDLAMAKAIQYGYKPVKAEPTTITKRKAGRPNNAGTPKGT